MQYNPTLHKLSNGVTVILDPMVAATTYVIVNFQTGSRDEKPSEYGLTHFCEHMLCKGTERFPTAGAIKDYVEDNAGFSGARTGHEIVELYGNVIAENTEVLLDVFADQLQNSVFAPDVLERERSVIADELRRAMDSQSRSQSDFVFKNIMTGNFSSYRTLGTFDNIASFTRTQMKMLMARRMTAKNCLICVSGKIDKPEKLLAFIERKFSWLPSFDVAYDRVSPTYKPAVAHLARPGKNNSDVAVLVPQLYELKDENKFKRMCVSRFNAYLSKELFRVLRTDNGLVYGVKQENLIADGLGINGFSAQTAPENVGRMVALMAQTAREVCTTKPITNEFLARFNNSCRLGDALLFESPKGRCGRLVSEYVDFGTLYDFNDIKRMSLEMTAKDIIANTQGYFDQPVSIISSGANFDADVMEIWRKNFGDAVNVPAMIQAKDSKCH